MTTLPSNLSFTKSHEWIRDNGDGTATIGITQYAQDQLGDVVYFEAPGVGDAFEAGDAVGTVESVKAVSDVYTPISGEISAINENLEDAPEQVNEDPYGEGWMFTVQLTKSDELAGHLDASAYQAFLDEIA